MPEQIKAITGKTLVPISLIVALIGSGGVGYFFSPDSSAKDIARVEANQKDLREKVYDKLNEINTRLSRIEGRLKTNNQ